MSSLSLSLGFIDPKGLFSRRGKEVEVTRIIAAIGKSLGVLSDALFSSIVV